MTIDKGLSATAAVLAMTLSAAPAAAAPSGAKEGNGAAVEESGGLHDNLKGPFALDVTLSALSDFRFRGISYSDRKAAVQPSVALHHRSGLYAHVLASNVNDEEGDIEVDYVLGVAPEIGGFHLDASATYYAFPRIDHHNHWEFAGAVSRRVGPGTVGFMVAYAPKPGSAVKERSLYRAVRGELPIARTPLKLTGSFGIEDNHHYSGKRDWSLGASADIKGFVLGAAYVDTARTHGDRLGRPTLLVSVSRSLSTSF